MCRSFTRTNRRKRVKRMIEELINKLERIEYEIKIYKRNLIEEIEREEMIPASNDLLLLRDLKEQQRTIQRIIKRLKMEEVTNE